MSVINKCSKCDKIAAIGHSLCPDCRFEASKPGASNNILFNEARALGLTELRIPYSGSGDEGSIEEIDEHTPDSVDISAEFEERIISWCYEKLSEQYGGWENSDGASGTIIIDLLQGSATFLHEWNVIRSEEDIKTVPLND